MLKCGSLNFNITGIQIDHDLVGTRFKILSLNLP